MTYKADYLWALTVMGTRNPTIRCLITRPDYPLLYAHLKTGHIMLRGMASIHKLFRFRLTPPTGYIRKNVTAETLYIVRP